MMAIESTLTTGLALAAIRVLPSDNVAVALRDLGQGQAVLGLELRQQVARGHKFALETIEPGSPVTKYGSMIGLATQHIQPGEHVHVHNLATALSGEEGYSYAPAEAGPGPQPATGTFAGYRRANGRVGTRNEIWILCTVGCVANTARRIAEEASRAFKGRVDGVFAYTHPFGCSQLGDDLANTRKIIASLASHPNAGGVLLVGLGCESNQVDALLKTTSDLDPARIRAFKAQDVADELVSGLDAVEELVRACEHDRRAHAPLSELAVGLKCGGSDSLSGLTANPLVGLITDRVTAADGTAILTEVPEIFGAERLLMARAVSEGVFNGAVELVNGFKRYFLDHNQPVSENPSPGNIAGGITTLEEKSLGAVQKAGQAPLSEVISYGSRVSGRGLALLEAPGNDAVASTALAAAGANVILFTTGRGTPLGFPVPALKIASNSALAARKPRWIDFNAGVLVEGADREQTADALMKLIIATASGQPTRAEENGEREIALWKSGVTL